MIRYALRVSVLVLLLVAGLAAAAGAQSSPETLYIELNKVEQADRGCRLYLLVENGSDIAFANLTVGLVFFDPDNVIRARSPIDLGRLRPNKTHVLSFTLEVNCADVGQVLLNKIVSCEHTAGTGYDCMDAIKVGHRGRVELLK